MHAMYFLYAGICLLIISAVIFGLRIHHKRHDTADPQDEKIRLGIIQTEAQAIEEQTVKFKAAMEKEQKLKKRKKETIHSVTRGRTKRTGYE